MSQICSVRARTGRKAVERVDAGSTACLDSAGRVSMAEPSTRGGCLWTIAVGAVVPTVRGPRGRRPCL